MNVMRFTGKNSRSALDQVRRALGPDALILSNRRTAEGIEICAAAELPDFSQPANARTPSANPSEFEFAMLKRELASLRDTLQSALGERTWQDTAAQRPVAATVAQRLVTLGLGRVLAGELSDALAPQLQLNDAWAHIMTDLQHRIVSLSEAEVAGLRIKAVIGGSGFGKSRAVDALLRQALHRHTADTIAVIRCASHPQSHGLLQVGAGQNIRVFSAHDRVSLADALGKCRWAREIIIDTPALNPALGSQDPVLSLLSDRRAGMAAILVVPATGHPDHLRSMAEHIEGLPTAGAIISKVDEAVSLGGVIDVVVSSDLPLVGRLEPTTDTLAAVSGGELLANAKRLAKRAMERKAAQLKVAI